MKIQMQLWRPQLEPKITPKKYLHVASELGVTSYGRCYVNRTGFAMHGRMRALENGMLMQTCFDALNGGDEKNPVECPKLATV